MRPPAAGKKSRGQQQLHLACNTAKEFHAHKFLKKQRPRNNVDGEPFACGRFQFAVKRQIANRLDFDVATRNSDAMSCNSIIVEVALRYYL